MQTNVRIRILNSQIRSLRKRWEKATRKETRDRLLVEIKKLKKDKLRCKLVVNLPPEAYTLLTALEQGCATLDAIAAARQEEYDKEASQGDEN